MAGIGQLVLFRDTRRKDQSSSLQPLSTRTLHLQWVSLAFLSIWLLACNIAATEIAVTGSVKTTAYLDGQKLPDSLVEAQEAQLGENPHYWAQGYGKCRVTSFSRRNTNLDRHQFDCKLSLHGLHLHLRLSLPWSASLPPGAAERPTALSAALDLKEILGLSLISRRWSKENTFDSSEGAVVLEKIVGNPSGSTTRGSKC